MNNILLAALGLLGAAGGSWYWQQRQEARLLAELLPLTQALADVNTNAYRTATDALWLMKETVAKDRNVPRDLAVLAAATHLQAQATHLLDTLRAQRMALQRATTEQAAPASLLHLDEHRLTNSASLQQSLQRQATAYVMALRKLPVPDSLGLLPLRFDDLPPVAILADLAHLENQILVSEIHAIRQLHRTVGAHSFAYRLVPVATAESAVVAPGDTYRARLFLVKSILPQSLRMYCDGQPVPTSPDGVGLVSFRAPTSPGPASWVGKIRITANGRDTTFVVRVPYRVARR